ncbi:MAG: hypothetical protein EXR72_05230 [Myxococcales bacterium]|nr:hypothetical protein [Myxococcales bacterium]
MLVGRVLVRGGVAPLCNARVQVGELAALSDEQGAFQLTLAPGSIEVVVTAAGYETLHAREWLIARGARVVEYRLAPSPAPRYQTTVAGEARHEGERVTIEREELRRVPGGLGDPVHTVAMLPGVALPLPLLPVLVVRGANPGTSAFLVDGMRVPQLFHLLIGDGSLAPGLVERVDFYPGGFDASFARATGGLSDIETRAARSDGLHGEVDVRLHEVSALVESALPRGALLAAAFRYGFPNPILHLFNARIDVDFWDYQVRADRGGLTLEALGSYDALSVDNDTVPRQLHLTYHRLQLRERHRAGPLEIEAAIVGGIDEMNALTGAGVRKLSLGARGGSCAVAGGASCCSWE